MRMYKRNAWSETVLRETANDVDDAERRGEHERTTSLTAWLTRAASHRKGTFSIYKWPTITPLLKNNTCVSFMGTSIERISLVARVLCSGAAVAPFDYEK